MEHKKNTDIHKFLNFELSSDEEVKFKNTEEYKKNQPLLELLDDSKSIPFDEEALFNNINIKKSNQPKVIPLYKKWLPISIAASILICCSTFFFYSKNQRSYNTIVAESIQFSLPDNSSVWLNAKSEISHNKDWNNSRDIELHGEAYFEVAKGKKFTVKTSQGTVTVLGTKFNVKQREQYFEVHCFEGSVSVSYKNYKTVLKANDMFSSKQVGKQKQAINKPNWLAKQSIFENSSLNNVLTDISLHYDIEFKKHKTIEKLALKYTGSYTYTDDLITVLDVLCKSLNLDYSIKNKSVYLSLKE